MSTLLIVAVCLVALVVLSPIIKIVLMALFCGVLWVIKTFVELMDLPRRVDAVEEPRRDEKHQETEDANAEKGHVVGKSSEGSGPK
jgi:hypothetical protein